MAFVIPEAGLPLGDSLTAHSTNIPSCITYPAVEEGTAFEIKQHMLNILPTFHGLSSDDPNMHIAEFLMGCKNILVRGFSAESIKLRGLNMTTKTLVNASCGGSYKDKNAQEACLLFEKMAADTQQWAVEQPQSRSVFEMSNGSPYVTAQIEKMEKRLDAKFDMLLQRIPGSQVAVQQPLQAACSICSLTNHDFLSYPHKDAYPEFMAEQVNSFNNFQRPRYDPYSNFYNPGWRDHSNLRWDEEQHTRPQFQQQVQQPAASKAAWEIALQVSGRAPGTFPSQTEPNPRGREECNAIRTLRSGKSYNNSHENSIGNSQAAELPQTKSAIFADSEISADSGKSQDRSENTAEASTKTAERVYEPPMPYPERLRPKAKDQQLTDFMKTLAKVQINLPLIDAIKNIPSYAKCLKDVCTKKKKLVDFEKVILTEQCSVVVLHKLPPKKKDPGSFTISCTIGNCYFSSALIDLGASVNLMPYSVFKRLGEGELKTTSTDFMVLDMDEDLITPIILGRPFLATALTLIDVEAGTLTFRVEDQTVVFKLFEASIHSGDKQEYMRVDALDGLPSAKFMNRSSADHLSIKPPNLTRDCTSPKPQQQRGNKSLDGKALFWLLKFSEW
nr:uncharacterized protein LOC114824540 [Malus domestica]